MGAAFGGSSQTLFGSGGPAGFMAKLTTAAAVCFMLTSLGLAYVSSNSRFVDVQLPTSQQLPVQVPAEETLPDSATETLPETGAVPEDGATAPPLSGEGAGSQ